MEEDSIKHMKTLSIKRVGLLAVSTTIIACFLFYGFFLVGVTDASAEMWHTTQERCNDSCDTSVNSCVSIKAPNALCGKDPNLPLCNTLGINIAWRCVDNPLTYNEDECDNNCPRIYNQCVQVEEGNTACGTDGSFPCPDFFVRTAEWICVNNPFTDTEIECEEKNKTRDDPEKWSCIENLPDQRNKGRDCIGYCPLFLDTSNSNEGGNDNQSSNGNTSNSGDGRIENPIRSQDFKDLLNRVIHFFMIFAGSVATLMVVYAGFLYTTSAGSTTQTEKAKNVIKHAIIGYIIVMFAYAIQSIVGSIL